MLQVASMWFCLQICQDWGAGGSNQSWQCQDFESFWNGHPSLTEHVFNIAEDEKKDEECNTKRRHQLGTILLRLTKSVADKEGLKLPWHMIRHILTVEKHEGKIHEIEALNNNKPFKFGTLHYGFSYRFSGKVLWLWLHSSSLTSSGSLPNATSPLLSWPCCVL